MTKVTTEDFRRIFEELAKMPIPKERYVNYYSIEIWKQFSTAGIYSMTHEQIDNAKDGFIGHFNGVDCYITPLFK